MLHSKQITLLNFYKRDRSSRSKIFQREPRKRYVELSRGTYDVEIQLTNVPNPRNIFNSNPSGVALRITKELTIVSSESPPWTSNPVGASAMIIPPPCPKVIEGTGFVERIDVLEPGNGIHHQNSLQVVAQEFQ